jgi:hypothetical protein
MMLGGWGKIMHGQGLEAMIGDFACLHSPNVGKKVTTTTDACTINPTKVSSAFKITLITPKEGVLYLTLKKDDKIEKNIHITLSKLITRCMYVSTTQYTTSVFLILNKNYESLVTCFDNLKLVVFKVSLNWATYINKTFSSQSIANKYQLLIDSPFILTSFIIVYYAYASLLFCDFD